MLLLQGSQYWRFDPSQRPPVKGTYPKAISNWEGLPNSIDDALQYSNGYTYFFKVFSVQLMYGCNNNKEEFLIQDSVVVP